jgi:uncharacterized iron-regulated protein
MLKTALLSFLIATQAALATSKSTAEFIYSTKTHQRLSVEEFTQSLASGDILVMGEKHATSGDLSTNENQRHQVNLLTDLSSHLKAKKLTLTVGMEFLEYPIQNVVNQFLAGNLTDDQFIKQAGWGSNPFSAYREQILAPLVTGGRTLALNIPRAVTSQIAKGGLGSLSSEQRALLPPSFVRGNDLYFERFKAVMAGHVPDEKLDDYFWAQSIWDETMAWKTLEGMNANSVTAIVVGEFHVEYGGGLPDRLLARGATSVKTLLQIPLDQMDDDSIRNAIAADPNYGEQADFLWLYQGMQ